MKTISVALLAIMALSYLVMASGPIFAQEDTLYSTPHNLDTIVVPIDSIAHSWDRDKFDPGDWVVVWNRDSMRIVFMGKVGPDSNFSHIGWYEKQVLRQYITAIKVCADRGHLLEGPCSTTLMYCPPETQDYPDSSVTCYNDCNSSSCECRRCGRTITTPGRGRVCITTWRRAK